MKFRLLRNFFYSTLWLACSTQSIAQETIPPLDSTEKTEKTPNLTELYFNTELTITDGLHDPQKILEDEQATNIKNLISEHQERSQIPITLFLFKQTQEISLTELKLKNRLNKIFTSGNHILVFYFYSEPLRSNGHLLLENSEESNSADWEVDEMFLKSSRDASVEVESFDQLQSYLQELSKRSFWVESKFITSPPQTEDIAIDSPTKQQTPKQSNQILGFLNTHILSLIAALAVIIIGIWFYLWSRRWRKFVLPLKEMPHRLGADYGATVSEPLEFSDVKVSLSDQRGKARNNSLDNI